MRLSELLGKLTEQDLRSIAKDRITEAESMTAGKLAAELETMIRSLAYVQHVLIASLPPTFSILLCLTEAPGGQLSDEDLVSRVSEHCEKLTSDVTSGALLGEGDDRLYRRVLAEAWRTDLSLHSDEIGLLGVLRHELGLFLVDHYLTCYHSDFFEYWKVEDALARALAELRACGLVYHIDGKYVLPEEAAPQVQRAMGVYMPRDAYRRLLGWLPNAALAEALRTANMVVSGHKAERMERLVARMVPPGEVMNPVALSQLQDIALQLGCPKSGARDALVDRLIEYFKDGLDHPPPEEPVVEVPAEARQLEKAAFSMLFESLTGRELSQILEKYPELLLSGTKAIRVSNLWNSKYSEISLLSELGNRQLAEILERHELLLGGSKGARSQRIIDHFKSAQPAESTETSSCQNP
jgi:hypothetical protein